MTRKNRAEEGGVSQPRDERTAVDMAQHFFDGLWQTRTQYLNFTEAFGNRRRWKTSRKGKKSGHPKGTSGLKIPVNASRRLSSFCNSPDNQ